MKRNLQVLAEATALCLPLDRSLPALAAFDGVYTAAYHERMRLRLGLPSAAALGGVLQPLLRTLQLCRADYTGTLRALATRAEMGADPGGASHTHGWYCHLDTPYKISLAIMIVYNI